MVLAYAFAKSAKYAKYAKCAESAKPVKAVNSWVCSVFGNVFDRT